MNYFRQYCCGEWVDQNDVKEAKSSFELLSTLHSVAETKVLTHVDISLLPAKRGTWTDLDSTVVTLALNTKGRQAFYQLYREIPSFLRCEQCPHGYLDTV